MQYEYGYYWRYKIGGISIKNELHQYQSVIFQAFIYFVVVVTVCIANQSHQVGKW